VSVERQLSVVIAVQKAEANLPAIREALQTQNHSNVEFIFAHAQSPESAQRQSDGAANVVDLFAGDKALIPELWRDGIRAAAGAWIATTTAHCVPAPDWVAKLQDCTGDPAAAIGGLFRNDERARAADWAVFLLRYAPFAAPQNPRFITDVAADNAIYRRDLILREEDLLRDGFWEPSFHARFRAQGHRLRLEPTLLVTHRNQYRPVEFFGQRIAHGRRFGRDRAALLSWPRRIVMSIAAPVLPLLFLRKVRRNALGHPICAPHFAPASGWLLFFLSGWGWGEGLGYLDALRGKKET
jgi:hypothetical protein